MLEYDYWKELNQMRIKRFDNKCHTNNRWTCYETDDETQFRENAYLRKIEQSHLFFDAVDCAEKVLNSARWINLSIVILLLMLLVLIR